MTTEEMKGRIEQLRAPCIGAEFAKEYFGSDICHNEGLMLDFGKFLSQHNRADACTANQVHRYLMETFFQTRRMWPRRWTAWELGMEEASLQEVIRKLPEHGLSRSYVYYGLLIDEALKADVEELLATFRFKLFQDHNAYCKALHEGLSEVLGVHVEAKRCRTSQRLGKEDPPNYSREFDCLTLEPLSEAHALWLNFGKPISLPPDRTSKRTYLEYRALLHDHLAGTLPPSDLDQYTVEMWVDKQ